MKIQELDLSYRNHIKALIDFLLSEVGSAGGDGDAAWVVKNFDIHNVREFINDECLTDDYKRYWTLTEVLDEKRFFLSNHQEGLMITIDHTDVPSWSQCTITV